jgi:glycosyltransferase involved in cell wall biosynthesis
LPETVSACLIVRDEEERLPAALESVAFCDQIVVVDSGSTDRTMDIAREAGALVVENPWPGYSAQRNVAIDHAGGDWVLEVDADEQITPELQREIRRFLDDPPEGYDIGAFPQFHRFLGGELRPSVKYPAYRTRLFRRGAYRHDESRAVHEGIWPTGPVWPFEHEMSHELAGSWREAITDTRNYARLEASKLPPARSRADVAKGAFVRPLFKFWYRLLIDGGWRDGWRGVLRIALDSWHDAIVWRNRGKRAGVDEVAGAGHFGAERPADWGSPLTLGIASGERAARTVAVRLVEARARGVDVVLVTDSPLADHAVRVRRVSHFGPLTLIRALEAERQLRGEWDSMLVEGRAARALARVLPGALRGRR